MKIKPTPQAANNSVYLPEMCTILETHDMTEQNKFFRVELSKPLQHKPGQFVMVSIMGVGEAPISISNGPTQQSILEMVIRRTGRLTRVLHDLDAGDTIGIRGPYGSGFDLNEFYGKDILFVAGGLGLAPLRSLITPVTQKADRFGRITIVSGARNPAEELYRDDLKTWDRIDNVTVLRLVDRTENMPWKFGVGLVTQPLPQLAIDPQNTLACLCGPPVMYKFVVMALSAKNLPAENIFVDLERRMKCGVGKCGHCQINHRYCCRDGPVFRLSDVANLPEALQ